MLAPCSTANVTVSPWFKFRIVFEGLNLSQIRHRCIEEDIAILDGNADADVLFSAYKAARQSIGPGVGSGKHQIRHEILINRRHHVDLIRGLSNIAVLNAVDC